MLYCNKCDDKTKSIEPIIIRRQDHKRFHIRALCANCMWTKAKYFSNNELKELPDLFWKIPLGHNFMKYLVFDKEIIEIFPLLDPIIN